MVSELELSLFYGLDLLENLTQVWSVVLYQRQRFSFTRPCGLILRQVKPILLNSFDSLEISGNAYKGCLRCDLDHSD